MRAGLASQPHLGMLAALKAIGAEGLGVPFTGAGPMAQALLSGTVMAIAETPAVAAASNLPVLAVLSEARIAALPDVRTMKELGYPAASFTAGGLIAPASTFRHPFALEDARQLPDPAALYGRHGRHGPASRADEDARRARDALAGLRAGAGRRGPRRPRARGDDGSHRNPSLRDRDARRSRRPAARSLAPQKG